MTRPATSEGDSRWGDPRQLLEDMLLDTVAPAERLRVEDQFFEDDRFYELLRVAEDEIVEDLDEGRLSPLLQRELEERPHRIADLSTRLEVNRELKTRGKTIAEPWPKGSAREPATQWRGALRWAAALLAGAGLAWLLVPWSQPSPAQEPYVLSPIQQRGVINQSRIAVADGVSTVPLLLEIPATSIESTYAVVVRNRAGETFPLVKGAAPKTYPWGKALSIELALKDLGPGPQRILVSEEDPAAGTKLVSTYEFSIYRADAPE